MTMTPASGRWTYRKIGTKAAVTYTLGMMLYSDATDNVPVVDASQSNIKGIVVEAKASSATTVSIMIAVPSGKDCTFFADMESGETITKANEGDLFDFADGALTISTASTYDPVELVKCLSSSKGEFGFNHTLGIEN